MAVASTIRARAPRTRGTRFPAAVACGCAGAILGSTFVGFVPAGADEFAFEPPVNVSMTLPLEVALGDVNGDGRLDLVVAALWWNTVTYVGALTNLGGRSFAIPWLTTGLTTTPGASPGVALGDLNGDGDLDLVVDYGFSGPPVVSLFPGRGDGTFGNRVDIQVGGAAWDAATGDVDADGREDLLLSSPGLNAVSLLRGRGDLTFDPPQLLPVPSRPGALVVAHLNEDAWLDVGVSGYIAVSLLHGLGGGAFAPHVSHYVGRNVGAIRAGDVDRDGRNDLLAPSYEFGTLAVLRARPGGTFGRKRDYAHTSARGAAIADLDGDGWPDLICAGYLADVVGVNRNRRDGTFESKRTFPSPPGASGLQAGDLDGDGVPDAILVHRENNAIVILYGRRSPTSP